LTWNVDCIQLIAKVEWSDVHDAYVCGRCGWFVRSSQKLYSSFRAGMKHSWYVTDEFALCLRLVPDLFDGTGSWKSEAPYPQSKFFGEPRKMRECYRRVLHSSGTLCGDQWIGAMRCSPAVYYSAVQPWSSWCRESCT